MPRQINTKELYSQIEKENKLNISFHFHTDTVIKLLNAIYAKLLSSMDNLYLLDAVVTIIKELIANAVKANAKRLYFQKLNLDINDLDSYQKGMDRFKEELTGNIFSLEQELKESEYRISVIMTKTKDGLKTVITNNAPILPEELNRINTRIEKAKTYNDFSDAYEDIYDDTEGAGLGIVLTTLLLRNSGIGENSYTIDSDGKVTTSQFCIPYKTKPSSLTTDLKQQIVNEVSGLPSFPDHIIELQRLCKEPDVTIDEIVKKIMLDPALTSDILKLSNSAGFIRAKRVENISDAVMVIGFKNLNDILTVNATRMILDKRYKKFQEIWDHCKKVAFYATNIASKYGLKKYIEKAYLAGLLHDIGKIVLLSADVKLVNRISEIIKNRKMRTSTIMEEISIGISHSSIGELMANKWHFPEYLIDTIKYHHSPLSLNNDSKELCYITYLANMLCGIENRKYQFYYIEEDVLERFKIFNESQFEQLHNELKEMYN
ncbi:MAG: HDOD domain-containing protein [Spirochaetota bacterium]|nr:HDOD domain-containing protein [Spirochaetota bacterium]